MASLLEHRVCRWLHHDPLQVIDFDGVGGLMEIGIEEGRATSKDLKVLFIRKNGEASEVTPGEISTPLNRIQDGSPSVMW